MYKIKSRILPLILISAALLLPLLFYACSPISPEQTTPGSTTAETQATTPETTAVTEPPMTADKRENEEERQMYNDYFAEHFDPELRNFVYDLIDNTQWPESNWNFPKMEEFYDEYLVFESHGKKILPYLLSYIEEDRSASHIRKGCILLFANKMLGYPDDVLKGGDILPSDRSAFYKINGFKWLAHQLWEDVFKP